MICHRLTKDRTSVVNALLFYFEWVRRCTTNSQVVRSFHRPQHCPSCNLLDRKLEWNLAVQFDHVFVLPTSLSGTQVVQLLVCQSSNQIALVSGLCQKVSAGNCFSQPFNCALASLFPS